VIISVSLFHFLWWGKVGLGFFLPMPSHTSASSQVHDESQERQNVQDDIRWARMAQIAVFIHLHIQPCLSPSPSPPISFSSRTPKLEAAAPTKRKARETEAGRLGAIAVSASVSEAFDRTVGGQFLPEREEKKTGRKRVFFLDVNSLCYVGSTPSLRAFGRWMTWVSLFLSQVSLSDPVIAVSSLSYV
jgi:hypothetical protein